MKRPGLQKSEDPSCGPHLSVPWINPVNSGRFSRASVKRPVYWLLRHFPGFGEMHFQVSSQSQNAALCSWYGFHYCYFLRCFKQEHSTNSRNSLERKSKRHTSIWALSSFNSKQRIFAEGPALCTRDLVITLEIHNQHPRLSECLAIPTCIQLLHYLVSQGQ